MGEIRESEGKRWERQEKGRDKDWRDNRSGGKEM